MPRIVFGDEGLSALHDEEADEHRRAEEDPHHHRGRLQRGDCGLLHRRPVQPAMQRGDEQRAESADAGRLDRRGDADEDHAEHQDDQQHRRDGVLEQPRTFRAC